MEKRAVGLDVRLELTVFFAIALSTLPLGITIPALVSLAMFSAGFRRVPWSGMGVRWPERPWRTAAIGAAMGAALQLSDPYWMAPLQRWLFGSTPNLEAFKAPTLAQLALWLLVSWTIAACFEEWLFRGYLIERLRDLFGESRVATAATLALSSLAFGGVHTYQGWPGAFAAAIYGVGFGVAYLAGGRSLLGASLAHGVADTIGFIAIYRSAG
jgi:membrane protease YdiL (CAAX protease family)